MFITEYDEEKARRDIYEDGYEDGDKNGYERGDKNGVERGVKRGRIIELWDLVKENDITLERAASRMNMTVEEFQSAAAELALN